MIKRQLVFRHLHGRLRSICGTARGLYLRGCFSHRGARITRVDAKQGVACSHGVARFDHHSFYHASNRRRHADNLARRLNHARSSHCPAVALGLRRGGGRNNRRGGVSIGLTASDHDDRSDDANDRQNRQDDARKAWAFHE